jgi:hypothetical protein
VKPQGVRVEWSEVASEVRDRVAAELGSPVVEAINQPGGFSPGVAARCRLADGRRCFIKAISAAENPGGAGFHRREAVVTAALPPGLPVPTLLAVVDESEWVVLAFNEIDGEPPRQPWTLAELKSTFDALAQLSAATTPCPIADLPTFGQHYASVFASFRTLAGGHPDAARLDAWTQRHLSMLADLEGEWEAAAEGESLLHTDLRADNLLVRRDGGVMVVDWPHACRGASWVDVACMLPSVGLDGGPSPIEVEAQLDPLTDADADAVNRVLVALLGYFVFQSMQPDPPGIPTVRAFQRAQGDVTRTWLAHRLGLD